MPSWDFLVSRVKEFKLQLKQKLKDNFSSLKEKLQVRKDVNLGSFLEEENGEENFSLLALSQHGGRST